MAGTNGRSDLPQPGAAGARPRRHGRGRLLALMGLALAVSPLPFLVPDPMAEAPALTAGPTARVGNLSPAAPLPDPIAPARRTAAERDEPDFAHGADAAIAATCPTDQLRAGERSRCLYDTIRTSELGLEAALSNAMRAIADRSDLAPVQRNRWKELLDEAQSRFLIYRNFDCQSVAPFEGRRGIGNFEARAQCLIVANVRRADELAARYPRPTPVKGGTGGDNAPFDGPQTRPGSWTFASPPPLQ